MAEVIPARYFSSDGVPKGKSRWLEGSRDKYGEWTFHRIKRDQIKEDKFTLLIEILISPEELKSVRFDLMMLSEAKGREIFMITRDFQPQNILSFPKNLIPDDGNFKIRIIRSGDEKEASIGIDRDSVKLKYSLAIPSEKIPDKISPYSFKSNGDGYKEYCWLSGSEDEYGRWTFIGLSKKDVKTKIKIKVALLVIKVDKRGKETEASHNILVNVGRLKTKKYVGGWGTQEEENWDYSIVKNLRKSVESGVPFIIEINKFLLPEDGNLAIKIIHSGGDNKPWIGIKKGSVTISY